MRRGGLRRAHIVGRVKRQITRLRHRRGHGVHSPYIYNIVREVFMDRKTVIGDSLLRDKLINLGVKPRYARELENLRHHCGLSTFKIDLCEMADMIICSTSKGHEFVTEVLNLAQKSGITVVILSPYQTIERGEMCSAIIDSHTSTTVNRRGYLIVFNNHLPKQHFTL